VVIADDQPLLRAGFRALLESAGDIEIVAEAGTGEEAVEQARRHLPDVVLMDIRMPGMDGIEATRQLTRTRVLILTTFGLDEYIIQALRAGASGFILKDTRVEDLLHAARTHELVSASLHPEIVPTFRGLARIGAGLNAGDRPDWWVDSVLSGSRAGCVRRRRRVTLPPGWVVGGGLSSSSLACR
jgi:DNA-binding NarL/FixJ family response regulator